MDEEIIFPDRNPDFVNPRSKKKTWFDDDVNVVLSRTKMVIDLKDGRTQKTGRYF